MFYQKYAMMVQKMEDIMPETKMKILYQEEIIEKCEGCSKVLVQPGFWGFSTSKYCHAYLYPASKWRSGNCPLASHLEKGTDEKKKLNPLKQSKRSMEEMK